MIHARFDELRSTGNLPTPSAIGLRILQLTHDEDYAQEELTRAIMADPALSSRILLLANSAAYDGAAPARDVPQAAMRLGASTVRAVALGFTLIADNRTGRCEGFPYDHFWSSSLATAVAASTLASGRAAYEPVEAFTCGLLAEVGRLALACAYPDDYALLLAEHPGARDYELAALERRAFQIDHVELGACLVEEWGLPPAYAEALRTHLRAFALASLESEPASALAQVVRAAKEIGRVLAGPAPFTPLGTEQIALLDRIARAYELDEPAFRGVWERSAEAWRAWAAQLEVPAGESAAWRTASQELERFQREETLRRDDRREARRDDATSAEAPARVLVVDDDERILRLLAHHLGKHDYEVYKVTSSREGLRLAIEIRPQILITDWTMPEISGVDLCRQLSQTEAGRRIHKIMLTAREDDDQVVEALDAGADDYVFKPFNPRILLARVRAGERMVRMREEVERSERVRLRQLAELGILTRKLRAAAMTDPLTELPNRRFAITRLKQEWESASRSGRPLSLTMIDVDHFKRVNDVHGHDVGDLVLRETAAVLRQHARQSDVLCRLGGEEFLVIHVDADLESALRAAERLRGEVEQHRLQHEGFTGGVTLSMGVAQRASEMRGVDDLLKLADLALYEAKTAGRNQVVCKDGSGPSALSA